MPEYIEREAAIKAIESQCVDGKMYGNENCTLIDPYAAEDEISSIPAADVAPVVHGRWKEYTGEDAGFHYCSRCKKQAFNYDDDGEETVEVLTAHCPHCGAKMDLEERTL